MLREPLLTRSLHILALFNLAVAQPLYDLIRGDTDFLVVRESRYAEILLAVFVLSFVLPAVLLLLEWLAGRISERLEKGVHLFFVALLISQILLRAFNLTLAISGLSILTLTVIAAVLFTYFYFSFPLMQTFLSWLGVFVLIIPALFVFNSNVTKAVATPPAVTLKPNNVSLPVVLIIFDELPLTSLLNAEGDIDALRYPNFAKLRSDSTWFKNASTVSGETARAVAAILTGRYPEKKRLTRVTDYPDNLFTLLGGTHEMKIIEPMTKLRPMSSLVKERSFSEKVSLLLSDLSAVYLNLVVPEDMRGWVPRVDTEWMEFWASMKRSTTYERFYARLEQFQIFLDSLTPSKSPKLYFLHLMMPHGPWLVLPSGKEYEPIELHVSVDRSRRMTWRGERWKIESDYMRHLLQLGYLDHMLGQLIDKLKQAGLYDKALIAVTADHGICFTANQPRKSRRHVTAENYPCLLPVPLFIRYPGLQSGSIDETNVQTIDILPTMADFLKVQVPEGTDGISAFAPRNKPIRGKIAYASDYTPFRFPKNLGYMDVVNQKLDLFGDGKILRWLMALPESGAIGKPVSAFTVRQARTEAELFSENAYRNVDLKSRYIPSLIGGQIFLDRPVVLAISVNGTIEAVTETFKLKDVQGFSAFVPESSFRQGKNEIEVFAILDKELHQFVFRRSV